MKYLILGDAGSGKSTTAKYLQKLGYSAYDTDFMPNVTKIEDVKTGKHLDKWPSRPIDWALYRWNWQDKALKQLLSSSETVFIAGLPSNRKDYYPLFDRVFVLTADPETIKQRILTRKEHSYGKHPGELKAVLDYHSQLEKEFRKIPNAIWINSTLPVDKVAKEILAHVNED